MVPLIVLVILLVIVLVILSDLRFAQLGALLQSFPLAGILPPSLPTSFYPFIQ